MALGSRRGDVSPGEKPLTSRVPEHVVFCQNEILSGPRKSTLKSNRPREPLPQCGAKDYNLQMADGPLLPWPAGPPPGPGLHEWDGQGAGPIHLIEVMMGAEIERLGGIQNIRQMVHAAWVRLSTAVGPAHGYVNVDDQRDAVLAVCRSVSIVEDILAPGANGPANVANDRVQKFKFKPSGRLERLSELMRLQALREKAGSGRHTTAGINFDAVHGQAETPDWKVYQNGDPINYVSRNSHATHDDYTNGFDMGATVNPFAEMDHPFARLITPHVTDVRSKPGGLHFLENFPEGNPPQPLVVPADVYDAVVHPHPWDVGADGPMPHLDAFGRHVDEHYIGEPWDMLITQVSSCCISLPCPGEQSFFLFENHDV